MKMKKNEFLKEKEINNFKRIHHPAGWIITFINSEGKKVVIIE